MAGAIVRCETQVIEVEHNHARGLLRAFESRLAGQGKISDPIFQFCSMNLFGGSTCARCSCLAASLSRVRRPFNRAVAFRVFTYHLANLRRDICIVIRGRRNKSH